MKDLEEQQQAINDQLIEELKTTTQILNESLEQKNQIYSKNVTLEKAIEILEKKLETFQENYQDLEKELPCTIVPSLVEVVVKLIIEKRKSEQYSQLLSKSVPSTHEDPVEPIIPSSDENTNPFEDTPPPSPYKPNYLSRTNTVDNSFSNLNNPFENLGNPF